MFQITQTFTHEKGFRITPIEMQGVGFVFLPKEIEEELGYNELSQTIQHSESFTEGVEYIILRNYNLKSLKELLNRGNSITSVQEPIYELLKHANALLVLTEAGLYTTMILSRKPNAVAFRRWITCEVLPSIRKTGMYKIPGSSSGNTDVAELLPELVKRIASLEQTVGKLIPLFTGQEHFQEYALKGFERIEAVLSESQPHDMFEGWKKIKKLVDDMTEIYHLSETERKCYIYELCQINQVSLPERALLESESSFYDAQNIALKMGLYSMNDKPHTRLVVALIRHLGLEQDKYLRKFHTALGGYRRIISKYSDTVVPHIQEWLQNRGYPKTIEITCGKKENPRRFQVKYKYLPNSSLQRE